MISLIIGYIIIGCFFSWIFRPNQGSTAAITFTMLLITIIWPLLFTIYATGFIVISVASMYKAVKRLNEKNKKNIINTDNDFSDDQ